MWVVLICGLLDHALFLYVSDRLDHMIQPVNPGNWAVSSMCYFNLGWHLIMLYLLCVRSSHVFINFLMFGTVGS